MSYTFKSKRELDNDAAAAGCVILLVVMPIIWLLNAFMFQYMLYTITAKDIHFGLDFLIGFLLGVCKPAAQISWIIFVFCVIYRILEYPIPINFGAM